MPLPPRRAGTAPLNIWPGWVDVLSSLLMVLIFVLLIFTISQFFLQNALSGRDQQLDRLNAQINQLTQQLAMERTDRKTLEISLQRLSAQLASTQQEREALRNALADQTSKRTAAEDKVIGLQLQLDQARQQLDAAHQRLSQTTQQLDQATAELSDRQTRLGAANDQIDTLNLQLASLRQQLEQLNALLQAQEADIADKQAQIVNLGKRLNQALANRVQELARYRSEFFGRLRKILGDRNDVRIVGDRFVFQSEVLFPSGSDVLEPAGQEQLARLAQTLKTLAAEIPPDLNWILRIDGHTDRIPIHTPEFASNWELSAARAISVVKFLIDQGIPPNRLAATGFGEYQPIEPGDTVEARQRNRRIEIKFDQR